MSKQSNPKFIGAMAIVFLLCGGGATYYQYNSLQEAKVKVADLEEKVPSQEELEKGLADTGGQLAEYTKTLNHLESEVPDVAYIPTLMKELEEVGKFYSIDVTGVRPVPRALKMTDETTEGSLQTKKKDYEEIEIEIKGRGNFEDVKNFLDALQKFPKVVAVKTINMTPQREGAERNGSKLEATINLVAYVFPFKFVEATGVQETPVTASEQSAAQSIFAVGGTK